MTFLIQHRPGVSLGHTWDFMTKMWGIIEKGRHLNMCFELLKSIFEKEQSESDIAFFAEEIMKSCWKRL